VILVEEGGSCGSQRPEKKIDHPRRTFWRRRRAAAAGGGGR